MADPRLLWQRRLGPLLVPAGWLYGSGQCVRRWAYGKGLFPTVRLDTPVVSVGSLVAGGTGKTPLVAYLARRFADRRVAILSRGYGGSYRGSLQVTAESPASLAGDEPVLLARLSGVPVWVARNRAKLALELSDRYELFLLDDGYQHLALERFLNICILPNESPGRVLPAGLWRETPGALSAADLVITLDAWPEWVGRYYGGPQIVMELKRGAWLSAQGAGSPDPAVFAFCGIARPERFMASIHDLEVRGSLAWPDHHPYSRSDLQEVQKQAQKVGAWALVTTAKDSVRISREWLDMPLFWCDVEVHLVRGAEDLACALEEVVGD